MSTAHISLGFHINQSHLVKEHRQGKAIMSAKLRYSYVYSSFFLNELLNSSVNIKVA